jgi:hypothetical protein
MAEARGFVTMKEMGEVAGQMVAALVKARADLSHRTNAVVPALS